VTQITALKEMESSFANSVSQLCRQEKPAPEIKVDGLSAVGSFARHFI